MHQIVPGSILQNERGFDLLSVIRFIIIHNDITLDFLLTTKIILYSATRSGHFFRLLNQEVNAVFLEPLLATILFLRHLQTLGCFLLLTRFHECERIQVLRGHLLRKFSWGLT